VARGVRVGFVEGSDPDKKQQQLNEGVCMKVLGIPRVDLALVSWRIEHKDNPDFPDALRWSLPYEIIAVGIFGDKPKPCGDD
jgi:hypothetical protein